MLRIVIKMIWRLMAVLGGILFLLLLGELARLYILLYRIDPMISRWYLIGLAVLAVILLAYLLWFLLRHPPIPQPPRRSRRTPDHLFMRRYLGYLVRYARHISRNPHLSMEHQLALRSLFRPVRGVLGAHPLNDDLRRAIQQAEEQTIGPALASLNEAAQAEVRHSVRDVMLAVTLSPYPAMDLLIVLYRNMAMTTRLLKLYHGRPRLRDQWRLFRDILITVATVNVLNLSRKLFESLLGELPLLGRVMESIGQGLGAGLVTSLAGHAAMDRCTAFRGWNTEAEARSLTGRVGDYLTDIRDLFSKDLLPQLKGLIRSSAPPGVVEQPGFWNSLVKGIHSAVDATIHVAQTLVVEPVVAVGSVGLAVAQDAARATHRRVRRTSSSVGRTLRTFAQRIFYSFRGPRFYD